MRISNYPTDVLTGSELILGTDRDTGTLKYKTVNFSVDTLKSFIYGGTNNQVIFEGTDDNENQTTLSAIEPSADITINLPNIAGTLPVLAAPSTTPIAATPEELNLLDTAAANTVVNSKAVIYGSSGELAGTLSTAAQPTITSVGTLTALTVDNIVINGAVIGHTSDTDLITLADGVATFAGTVNAVNYKINGSQGSDGQVLTSTGSGVAWEDAAGSTDSTKLPLAGGTLTGALTVGEDDTGYDVKFFGDTTLKSMLWDASEDSLIFPENTKVKFLENSGGDCSLYNDTNGNFYMENTSGWTILACRDGNGALGVMDVSGTASLAAFYVGGGCHLYHNNSKKIETTTSGIKVSGGIEMGLAASDPTRVDLQSAQAITHNDHKGRLLFDAPDAGIADGALSAEITFNNTAIDADANVIIQMQSNIVADVIVYNIADDSCKFKILNKSGGAIADGTDMDLVYTVINQN